MVWGAIAGAGLQLAGGLLSGRSAKKAAAEAARQRTEQANSYWDSAQFRPVGMTTRFGSSSYERDANGNITGAGYELNPEFAAMQDRLIGDAGSRGLDYADQVYGAGQGLFGLGQQYLAQSPEEAAQSWMANQQDVLAPGRERGLAAMRNSVFNKGTAGLAVGATGTTPQGRAGLGASNPEMEAYYNSIAQQDAGLAAQATEQGRNQVKFGAGLFGTGMDLQQGAYSPYSDMMRYAATLEEMGMQPYQMGLDLGKTASDINGAARYNWASLMSGANDANRQANSFSPWGTALQAVGGSKPLMDGVGSLFGK